MLGFVVCFVCFVFARVGHWGTEENERNKSQMGIYLQTEISALKGSLTFVRGELIKTAETEKLP